MHMNASPRQLSPWWSLSIVPYLWIGLVLVAAVAYAFPQTDDYCTFSRLYFHSHHNPLRETWYMYENWTGRYSASFVVAAVGWLASVSPMPLQWVYAGSLAIFLGLLFWASVRATQLVHEGQQANVPLAAIMFAAITLLMPSKLEGLFWLTGVAVYSFGIIVLPLLWYSILRDGTEGRNFSYRSLAYIVIAVGFNEFIGLALGVFLALRLIPSLKAPGWFQRNLAYLTTYVVAFAATVLAPGNFVRDATISTQRHDLSSALQLSIQSAVAFTNAHITPYWGTLAGLSIAAVAAGWLMRSPSHERRNWWPASLALIASFPMHLLVYSFLTGEQTPGRVINQAYAMALMGYLIALAWAGARLAARKPAEARWPAALIITGFGLCMMASPPLRNIAITTRDFGPIWRAEQVQRHNALLFAGLGATASVPPLSRELSASPILRGADVTSDPHYWINTCVADYYQLKSIVLETR